VVETKAKKRNIVIKMIPKPSVATVIDTHFEVDIATMEINNSKLQLYKYKLGRTLLRMLY
jgi:hypothetical protein